METNENIKFVTNNLVKAMGRGFKFRYDPVRDQYWLQFSMTVENLVEKDFLENVLDVPTHKLVDAKKTMWNNAITTLQGFMANPRSNLMEPK